ncbi:permease [Paenibacillus macerans]|uniref:permease n=1 Tax=Paenibacillus macerans TaxID=44252 RepID=UPI003D313B18
MNKMAITRLLPILVPAAFALACLTVLYPSLIRQVPLDEVQTFKTSFIGILLEALPFVLIGALLSSLLHLFVSEETLRRWMPKHPVPGILFACLLGLIFPVCECGMIPLIRRMIQKGMPVYIAVVFILSGPILNPVVFSATYMAFRMYPEMVYARMGLAFAVSAAIGAIVYLAWKDDPLKHSFARGVNEDGPLHPPAHGGSKLVAVFVHAADEVFEMGKYLLAGCILTAGIQSFVAKENLAEIGGGSVSAYLFMMGFAFVLSLCSTSDAFVASTFLQTFSGGSLLAFLVFGPMLDFKNALMLLAVFRAKFVLFLAFLISTIVFTGAVLVDMLGL